MIETERLFIRPFRISDAEDAFEWRSDTEVNRFMPYPCDESVEALRERIAEWIAEKDKYAIVLKGTEKVIGDITLEFSKKMIPAIYDEFGDETEITKIDDNKFTAEVDAQISPTFWGWLFTFQGQIKIAGPEEVQTLKTQYLAYLVFD